MESVIEKHNINIDNKHGQSLVFYTYYSNKTPIYFEIEPVIKIMRFSKSHEVLASIPLKWIKLAADFNDDLFKKNQIHGDTVFAESSAIAYLIAINENKNILNIVTNLYNTTIRNIENMRMIKIHDLIVTLNQQITDIRDELASCHNKINELKDSHEHQTTHHGSMLGLIKAALGLVSDGHLSVLDTLKELQDKL